MLELKGLSYQVDNGGGTTANILNGIDLTVSDNKFIVITGPNGGGKTSLAKTIMGLYQPTGGQILWNGTDITNMSITDRAKLWLPAAPPLQGHAGPGPAGAGLRHQADPG